MRRLTWQISAGHGQGPFIPQYMIFSTRHLECLLTLWLASLRVSDGERRGREGREGRGNAFYDLAGKTTILFPQYSIGYTVGCIQSERGYTRA